MDNNREKLDNEKKNTDNERQRMLDQQQSKIRKVNVRTIITAVLLCALVLIYFNYLNNKSAQNNNKTDNSEIQKLIKYDMSLEYPNTPRDVAKLHARYTKTFYGKTTLTDKEIKELSLKVRNIYCSDMKEINPEDIHYNNLITEIAAYKERKVSITSYQLPEASQIQYLTKDGKKYATFEVRYTIETSDEVGYYYQDYVLVKEEDQWKIYGWTESDTVQ